MTLEVLGCVREASLGCVGEASLRLRGGEGDDFLSTSVSCGGGCWEPMLVTEPCRTTVITGRCLLVTDGFLDVGGEDFLNQPRRGFGCVDGAAFGGADWRGKSRALLAASEDDRG